MHFPQLLAAAVALLPTSVIGSDIRTGEVEVPSELEARNPEASYNSVNNCQKEIKQHHNYRFCKTFYPTKTIIVKKVIIKKKGIKTIYRGTKYAPCTAANGRPLEYYGKRDAEAEIYDADSEAWFAKREAEANADAAAEADAEAHYFKSKKCKRNGVPYALQMKYSCKTIKQACKAHYRRKTKTKTVSHAILSKCLL
jgi:hypothetical protein